MYLPTFQGHDLLLKVYRPETLYYRLKNNYIFVSDTSLKAS